MLRSRRSWNIFEESCEPRPESLCLGFAAQTQTMGIIKAIVGFLIIAAVVVGLFQVAPPMLANYSFSDDLKTIGMIDSSNLQKTDDDIRNDVMKKVKEHDLPIEPKQITVQHINTPGLTAIYLSVDYTVTVNLPGYSFDMHFNPTTGNKGF